MAGELPYQQNPQTVRELLANFYGGPFLTDPRQRQLTVGTSVVAVYQTVKQRVSALVQNTGTSNIWLKYDNNVAVGTGILIAAGKSFVTTWYYDGTLMERQLYAISDAGGGSINVFENCLDGV